MNRKKKVRQGMIGSVIPGAGKKYQVLEKIGVGGYAVAYKVLQLAKDPSDNKECVMKIINLEFFRAQKSHRTRIRICSR